VRPPESSLGASGRWFKSSRPDHLRPGVTAVSGGLRGRLLGPLAGQGSGAGFAGERKLLGPRRFRGTGAVAPGAREGAPVARTQARMLVEPVPPRFRMRKGTSCVPFCIRNYHSPEVNAVGSERAQARAHATTSSFRGTWSSSVCGGSGAGSTASCGCGKQKGVFSYETALPLLLSDVLPKRAHLSVPPSWRRRRLRVPRGLVLHDSGLNACGGGVGDVTVLKRRRLQHPTMDSHLSSVRLSVRFARARASPARDARGGRQGGPVR
jgi:hypothetical protein